MEILVVGSIALDTVRTPFGEARESLGGSATYFAASAVFFAPVNVVGVVGEDFDLGTLGFLLQRGVSLDGVAVEAGKTFRWSGVYDDTMGTRRTLETQLNVFADFRPRIPERYRDCACVFLANIQPELQLDVLGQVDSPRLVACDTMDLWIATKSEALRRLLAQVDILILNDSEIRQLAGETNLIQASRRVLALGPRVVIVKKGEHGAWMVSADNGTFAAPAFPTESVLDPTGAGDTFAGGLVGHLARAGRLDPDTLRQGIVYGTAMASFCVERFGAEGLRDLTRGGIQCRFDALQGMTSFTPGSPLDAVPGSPPRAAGDSRGSEERATRMR